MATFEEHTHNLNLPYIMPSQAQKHVIHNEAIRKLDALVQATVLTRGDLAPPLSPSAGQGHIVGTGATDEWAGHDQELAFFIDNAWMYFEPKTGWRVWDSTTNEILVWQGETWVGTNPSKLENMEWVGINSSADSQNRLSVSAANTLFNHDGSGHQAKINKATVQDTASILFQTGFSGRAEIGLPGNDKLELKVSSDGSNWLSAMQVNNVNGAVRFPNLPTAVTTLDGGWKTTANGDKTGFTTSQVLQGGFTLGSEIAPGMGKYLVVPMTGLYAVSIRIFAKAGDEFRISLLENLSGAQPFFLENNHSATKAYTQDATTILPLSANDNLCFIYSGSSELFHAASHTQLCLSFLG